MTIEHKPTPIQLRERHGLDIPSLADAADVLPAVVYDMYVGQPVARDEAVKVLNTISARTGIEYSLANVAVAIDEIDEGATSGVPE